MFYELYADRAAFDFHEEQPHIKRLLAEREQYLSGVDVTFMQAEIREGG
ncbi:putative quinol monooxygenase [Micromonospora vinacea]